MPLFPKITFGDYPSGYDPKVHGPFDPARYYGKPDTPFGEVKLGELTQWIGRRNKSLRGFSGVISRAYWRWTHKYVAPIRSNGAYAFQAVVATSILWYTMNWGKRAAHRHSKYHF